MFEEMAGTQSDWNGVKDGENGRHWDFTGHSKHLGFTPSGLGSFWSTNWGVLSRGVARPALCFNRTTWPVSGVDRGNKSGS